ncbi:MAG: VTT domain-containing protein, partial [Opitutaceae bacterium]
MALLPAVGMPMMAFSLTAGPAFAPVLGVGGTVAAALAAATTNLLITYWLARRALRPVLERLMERFGYRLPEMETRYSTDLIVILRVTPGIPFFAQNYLLGLADAPVGRYLGISCAVVWTYTSALIVFGDALRRGSAKSAAGAIAAVVVAGAVTHLVRRRYAGRKAGAHAAAGALARARTDEAKGAPK